MCLRPDLAGVTSLVRALGLSEASYYCLLHFFHSPVLDLERLTRLWQQSLQRLFCRSLVRVNGRAVVLVDGLKRPKEGKKMPGSKACIRSPVATPRLPLSWAIPSRPWRCWLTGRGFIWPCRWPPAFTKAWSKAIATGVLCWIN